MIGILPHFAKRREVVKFEQQKDFGDKIAGNSAP